MKQSKGSIMLEAAAGLSVLILLIFGVLAVNSQIQQRQKLNSILRNISLSIVEECYGLIRLNDPGDEGCLDIALNNGISKVSSITTNFAALVSVYTGPPGAPVLKYKILNSPSDSNVEGIESGYDSIKVKATFGEVLNKTDHITLIEVFLRDDKINFPFRKSIFGSSDKIYESVAF